MREPTPAEQRYWDPIYIIEFEDPDSLFPYRISYYHENEITMIRTFEQKRGLRLIKKSMLTGNEQVIREAK